MIHNRIAQFAIDNPDATEYYFHTDIEADEILFAMASVMQLQAKELDKAMADKYRYEASRLDGFVTAGKSMQYINDSGFVFSGLHLVGAC